LIGLRLSQKHKGIESRLVITKPDLGDAETIKALYNLAGIQTYIVSGLTGEGVSEFLTDIDGKIAVFTGNSGVGKSSVLNCIDNALELKTAQISDKLGESKHTTRHIELFRIGNGYIADTPGFSSLDFESGEHISKEDLPFCFEEFLPYLGQCRFSTCAHVKDAGCRILEAVKSGDISASRHKSYTAMYREVKDRHDWQ
jgi:ribosome biogenesis GTPase